MVEQRPPKPKVGGSIPLMDAFFRLVIPELLALNITKNFRSTKIQFNLQIYKLIYYQDQKSF
jgi:hypothetical protein